MSLPAGNLWSYVSILVVILILSARTVEGRGGMTFHGSWPGGVMEELDRCVMSP